MKSTRDRIVKISSFIAMWITVVAIVSVVFSENSLATNYALLSAWWASFYFSRLLGLDTYAAMILVLAYAVYAVLAGLLHLPHFYHDAPESMSFFFVGVSLLAGVVVTLPILLEIGIRKYFEPKLSHWA